MIVREGGGLLQKSVISHWQYEYHPKRIIQADFGMSDSIQPIKAKETRQPKQR